ncbi:MAG: RAMP superfamily CRISPR-associated protein [Planctomycetota bacterium]|nr:RAMP superfamily CRISPR-associated protein [Planctomycetota bacterium]MCX8039197.1 RAMP superfamily CRISPR-associated protein [Planctomycetota bacterium]MDW8373611.1 RAMP superfamily CRISPR-associated protein [Planctomycetota bacterium]
MTALSIHRLTVPLVFPEGVHPGAGKDGGNRLAIALDGQNRPVLRGTALAGALRHAYAGRLGVSAEARPVARWFGSAFDEARGERSPLQVADTVLEAPAEHMSRRTHNSIDRHRGSVREGALVELAALPPQTRGTAVLVLESEAEAEAPRFLAELLALLDGMTLGGHAARGIGRVALAGPALYRRYDLRQLAEAAAWLDERYHRRFAHGSPLPPARSDEGQVLTVRCVLAIPRGQDLCIGDGQGLEYEIEPQRVLDAEGRLHWRIPGSSLRGVFRAWITRLAAREGALATDPGRPRSDTLAAHRERPADGADILWGRATESQRIEIQDRLADHPRLLSELVPCPVMRLFGSGYAKGRLHISDALARKSDDDNGQPRMHVAVDRITGGANDGFLFSNTVLCDPQLRFAVTIRIVDPEEREARWLAACLRALDLGLLRIGSSKAAGRLALAAPPQATGPHAAVFTALTPSEV